MCLHDVGHDTSGVEDLLQQWAFVPASLMTVNDQKTKHNRQ